jgi:FixJ family two-component response regulator
MDGLELIARLCEANPLTVCLLITVHTKGAVGFRAHQAGAFDFLTKPFSNEALLDAVHAAPCPEPVEGWPNDAAASGCATACAWVVSP